MSLAPAPDPAQLGSLVRIGVEAEAARRGGPPQRLPLLASVSQRESGFLGVMCLFAVSLSKTGLVGRDQFVHPSRRRVRLDRESRDLA
jgi:hypothetical protein